MRAEYSVLTTAGLKIWHLTCSPLLRFFADDTLQLLARLRLLIQLIILVGILLLAGSPFLGTRFLTLSGLAFDVGGVLRLFLYEEIRDKLEPFADDNEFPYGPPSVVMRELIMPEAGPYDASADDLSAFYFEKRGVFYLFFGFVLQFAATLLS
jgi:hypothetical protein